MTRVTPFSSPLLLGFDAIERALDRVSKSADGYPPYNIERVSGSDGGSQGPRGDILRITLAVAGFRTEDLDVTIEDSALVIRGRQTEAEGERTFLHRGIAARQFQRSFVLAEGMDVIAAELKHGLLSVDLARPEPETVVRRIIIDARG